MMIASPPFRRLAAAACALAIGSLALAAGPLDGVRDFLRGGSTVVAAAPVAKSPGAPAASAAPQPGVVNCANLVYGESETSVCFSSQFLTQTNSDTHIRVNDRLMTARLESVELFQFPFAVMSGEGSFSLTAAQRSNLREYLQAGGFVVASSGCSSSPWRDSFRREIAALFPEVSLEPLDFSHPVFHTVYDISELKCKGSHRAHLEGLEIDGKIALIFSPDGLNDTSNAGGSCCCCGGNEIKNARQMNVNLLAYSLTH
jgi:hypothetical protein